MTSINHANNLSFATLYIPPSTPPPSSAASSTGWTRKITKKIEDLKKQLDDLKNLKNAKNGYLTENDSKSLDSLPTQLASLETVQKLAEFADQLDTAKTNSNDILNNLCDGLQTFLGFNKDSKGYNGTGIVYSDLDRLCDGVMGFLHGVLEGVKTDDAVTAYDNHMPIDNKVSDVLKKLQSSIGCGRDGLVKSVGAVKGWLEGYESHIRWLTYNVANDISTLQDDIEGKYINDIHATQELGEQLKQWIGVLQDIAHRIDYTLTEHANLLDIALRRSVIREIDVVYKSVQMLKTSAEEKAFATQVLRVDAELVRLRVGVQTSIDGKCDELKNTLQNGFTEINTKLLKLRRDKTHQIERITESLKAARELLGEQGDSFNNNYKSVISAHFETVKEAVESVHEDIVTKKKALARYVEEVAMYFWYVEELVGDGKQNSGIVGTNWGELKNTITGLVDKLTNAKNPRTPGNLDAIVKGVQEYTAKFTEKNLGMNLEGWMLDIYSAECVSEHITAYAGYINAHKVQSGITNYLKSITNAIAIKTKSNETAEDHLNHINTFFAQLAGKMSPRHAGEMAMAIDGQLKAQRNHGISADKSLLEPAVKNILQFLLSVVNRLRDELQGFTSDKTGISKYNLGKNVQDALKTIESIRVQFDDRNDDKLTHSLRDYGANIDKALGTVKEKMGKLDKMLAQNGGALKSKVNEISSDILSKIRDIKKSQQEGGVIETEKHEAECLMDGLRYEVENKIILCYEVVKNAGDALSDNIEDLRKSVESAYNKSLKHLSAVKSFLIQKVQRSYSQVTSEVRKLFSDQRMAELEALHKCVEKQLAAVKEIIDKDKVTGIKGMLKMMHDYKKQLDEITSVAPTQQPPAQMRTPTKYDIYKLTTYFKNYSDPLLYYIQDQIRNLDKSSPGNDLSQNVDNIHLKLVKFLAHLIGINDNNNKRLYTYDHPFTVKLSRLSSSLASLSPSAFANPRHPELLDAVKKGLKGFVEEMGRVYVNGYDGETIKWIENEDGDDKLTVHGKNGAKVFLNVLSILHTELNRLVKYCQSSSRSEQINKSTNVGMFFLDQGYDVSDDGKQNGELQDDMRMTVFFIYKRLFGFDDRHIYKKDKFNQEIGALKTLHEHLQTYYQLGHVATSSSKRRPCSIFEMLCWLSGLPCNTVYEELWRDAVSDLFIDPKKQPTEDDEIPVTVVSEELPAYPQAIELANTQKAVKRLCSRSYDVLIKIVGYGNEYTQYAVEYCDNSLRLSYPSDPSQCLELLLDILRRLFPVFKFLYSQCNLPVQHGGWQECEYGKNIRTTKWPCKEHITDEVACQANDQPNTKPKCQPTSPLMSYLNDCLPGHLPHQVSSIGCKYDCATCPSTSRKGQPCLTPLGFRGFSGSTKTGRDLCSMLSKMIADKHLTSLFCLVTKPPKTLPEHFEFALSLVGDWIQGAPMNRRTNEPTVQSSFESSIKKLSINLCKSSALNNALMSAYGSQSVAHESCDDHHLRNLATADICHGKQNAHVKVAPYVASLCCDSYYYLAYKSTDTYASWAIYLPWTFWDLLNNLYNDFCNIFCADWGCRKCLRGDKCRPGQHGLVDDKTDIPHCSCTSIVGCKGVSPLFYKYGLVFGNASELNKSDFRKTCSDFCGQLKNVLQSQYFKNLFRECDEFLWVIREPFSYLVLALWSLSLFYLICVMVGRLDVLHIRSHLRIPSSHRITAQSLLAAAQVGRLAKISYLQP